MTPEFREGEKVRDIVLPCCVCGGDSHAYASYLEDGAYVCKQCSDHEDGMTDVEADADTLASAGYGTDEDYGYFGGEDY